MQVDELRSELMQLADEIGTFEGDVHALHRHDRRRQVVKSALAAALIVVVGASTFAAVRHRDNGTSTVTAAGPKEVRAADLSHIDVIVVPAIPAVETLLDSSPLVSHYAPVPRAARLFAPQASTGVAFCALENRDGFAVQAATPRSDIAQALSRDLARRATVYDISNTIERADIELFLRVNASTRQTESVRTALNSDPDVRSFQEVTKADAYQIFKQEFVGQPALIQQTKPSDLPESFLITLKPGTALDTTVRRYEHLDGAASVLTPQATLHRLLFSSAAQPKLGVSHALTCRAGSALHP
jgi:hypothetical protein